MRMPVHRRLTALTGAALLTASLGGCASVAESRTPHRHGRRRRLRQPRTGHRRRGDGRRTEGRRDARSRG